MNNPLPALYYELSLLPEFRDCSLPNSTPEENAIRTIRLLARKASRMEEEDWVPIIQRRPTAEDAKHKTAYVLTYQKQGSDEFFDAIRHDRVFPGISHWRSMPLPPKD